MVVVVHAVAAAVVGVAAPALGLASSPVSASVVQPTRGAAVPVAVSQERPG